MCWGGLHESSRATHPLQVRCTWHRAGEAGRRPEVDAEGRRLVCGALHGPLVLLLRMEGLTGVVSTRRGGPDGEEGTG
jgi:hypothetical protein